MQYLCSNVTKFQRIIPKGIKSTADAFYNSNNNTNNDNNNNNKNINNNNKNYNNNDK